MTPPLAYASPARPGRVAAPARATLTALALLVTLATSLAQQPFAPRAYYGALHEPVATALHGVGQVEEIALGRYAAALPRDRQPALFSSYIPTRADPERLERTMRTLRDLVDYYPDGFGVVIGMSMLANERNYEAEVVAGVHDARIDATARSLDSLGCAVLIRIGYESNGFWNHYDAATYVAAFRHITDRLRAISPRIATVWSVHAIDPVPQLLKYYPGDAYVDWWDISVFQPRVNFAAVTLDYLDTAHAYGKPCCSGSVPPSNTGSSLGPTSAGTPGTIRSSASSRPTPASRASCTSTGSGRR